MFLRDFDFDTFVTAKHIHKHPPGHFTFFIAVSIVPLQFHRTPPPSEFPPS